MKKGGFLNFILHKLEKTKVFCLIGTSGSGKSYNAIRLVREYHIDILIDDGILIENGRIIAGKSSKEEKTEMLAVRRAIFQDPLHAESVRRVLLQKYYPRILILGTSLKMIDKICDNLYLPRASKVIKIEDISSKEDIRYAHKVRDVQSKHIVPLPYYEIKRYLKSQNSNKVSVNDAILDQKTQVSPQFGRRPDEFSQSQLKHIINEALMNFAPGFKVSYLVIKEEDGLQVLDVSVSSFVEIGKKIDRTVLLWSLSDYLKAVSPTLKVNKIV